MADVEYHPHAEGRMKPTVYILTWCPSPQRLHAATLVFKTLRVGFPTSRVVVVDNCSEASCVPQIKRLALNSGCEFYERPHPTLHHCFIADVVQWHAGGGCVFLDPDVSFWGSMEDRQLRGVMAGRLLPAFQDPYTDTLTAPRLHTSLLWVDPRGLRDSINTLAPNKFEFEPFRPMMFFDGVWKRFDTGAALYALLGGEAFTDKDLDCYDHLFCGSHLNEVTPHLDHIGAKCLTDSDEYAKVHGVLPKGLWKSQESLFKHARAAFVGS